MQEMTQHDPHIRFESITTGETFAAADVPDKQNAFDEQFPSATDTRTDGQHQGIILISVHSKMSYNQLKAIKIFNKYLQENFIQYSFDSTGFRRVIHLGWISEAHPSHVWR